MTLSIVNEIELFNDEVFREGVIASIKYCQLRKGLQLNGWCLMPNKLYLIGKATGGQELGAIICDLKKFTSKSIIKKLKDSYDPTQVKLLKQFKKAAAKHRQPIEHKVWKEGYFPDELFSPEYKLQKIHFMHTEPVENGKIKYSWEYEFSSAKDYLDMKRIVEVTRI
jgi:putative transposase